MGLKESSPNIKARRRGEITFIYMDRSFPISVKAKGNISNYFNRYNAQGAVSIIELLTIPGDRREDNTRE